MGNKLFIVVFGLWFTAYVQAQIPTPCSGKLVRIEQFKSNYVTSRNIDIWQPDLKDTNQKLAVIYMHDGQMLFDSLITWNKQEWNVDETVQRLLNKDSIRPVLIVGIHNTPNRRREYFPNKAFDLIEDKSLADSIKKDIGGQPLGDLYLKFIVDELKPFIDSSFKVYTDKSHTYVSGASMGGLISFYALGEYPHVFSKAACLSTHWPGSVFRNSPLLPDAFMKYAKQKFSCSVGVYFDTGTATLDQWYGYGFNLAELTFASFNCRLDTFVFKKFEGANHSEMAWGSRFHIPLQFLIAK